tara:strand:+ start:239 stop:2437 length:2199 start_codon:yes stop_codon:yes gene_type:complete
MSHFIYNGKSIEFKKGDSALIALQRNGIHPNGGGCICLSGDCPHCIATVDGIPYVRTCQITARKGMVIDSHPTDQPPPVPNDENQYKNVFARNIHCDTVVIGAGKTGKSVAQKLEKKGQEVIMLEATEGKEVVGIYPGPLVVVRTSKGMLHVHPSDEIIVATGAAELHPVVPGNDLKGIVTSRAATQLNKVGVDLGRVISVGAPPKGILSKELEGELIEIEGKDKVEAIIAIDSNGEKKRFECDTVSIGIGLYPRDVLARMGNDLPVQIVGDAGIKPDIPPCPKSGIVCHCANVTVEDMDSVRNLGFEELELLKRGTLAGTGTCQGSVCLPYIRSFLADKGKKLQAPFTARPVTRQPSVGEMAAGSYYWSTPRTALDGVHRRLGAQMERLGGWWRPWNYGDVIEEYRAVRETVSLCDVSTLGKMLISGPDALKLLEYLYPTKVSTIKIGRSRYALLLDERGYVLDDGMICRDGESRFTLSFTSGGATFSELWVRDWAESMNLDVRILNQTMSLGAINVTGPLSMELLNRAGLHNPPKFLHHTNAVVADIECRVYRLSFTGEKSFELHHSAADSVKLWNRLFEYGKDLGIKPHGLEALMILRLEKGHIVVGQDTDFDSTPRRINHEWAVKLDKADFIGKQAVLRTNKVKINRQLVGFEMDGPAPNEGTVIWDGNNYAGYVTSSGFSLHLNKSVMLGWLNLINGELPSKLTIDGRPANRVKTPFYDPEGTRARF